MISFEAWLFAPISYCDILSTRNNLILEDAEYANIVSAKQLSKHYLRVWE